jgi:ABC-type Fe2+-enterobactin transport system substrate-binding protein
MLVHGGDEKQRIPFATGLAPVLLYVDQAWRGTASLQFHTDHRGNPSEVQADVKRMNKQADDRFQTPQQHVRVTVVSYREAAASNAPNSGSRTRSFNGVNIRDRHCKQS